MKPLKVKISKENFYYNIFNTVSANLKSVNKVINNQAYNKALTKDFNKNVTERITVFKRLERL